MTGLQLICPIVAILLFAVAVALLLQAIFGPRLGWAQWAPVRLTWPGGFLLFRQTSVVRTVVNHLSAITRLHLPLAQALHVTAESERGRLAVLLGDLGTQVSKGLPLSTALRRAEPSCPPLVTSMIAAGEQAGRLPDALDDVQRTLSGDLQEAAVDQPGGPEAWLYPVGILFFTLIVLTFVVVLIVPKYEEIFSDYDAVLPAATVNLIDAARWGTSGASPVLAAGALLLLFVVAPAVIALTLREPNESMTQVIVDTAGWVPRLTRPIEFGKGMSIALGVLGLGLAAGMTLPAAANLAATVRINRYLRRRWDHFGRLLNGGAGAADSAREAGLGNVFAWACRSLERGQADAGPVLRHAADYHRATAARWWRGLFRMAWPVVTCLLGCLVGYVVLALFLPIVALINAVAEVAI